MIQKLTCSKTFRVTWDTISTFAIFHNGGSGFSNYVNCERQEYPKLCVWGGGGGVSN